MEKNFKYKTRQRQYIIEYLKNNKSHVTAENIIEHFKEQGNPIGKSTVYRCLDSLVEEHIVRKYINSVNSSACFQYIKDKEKCNCHYHMKCTKCGNLFHLDCDEINELQTHIFNEHKFKIDICQTILYGTCEKCLLQN